MSIERHVWSDSDIDQAVSAKHDDYIVEIIMKSGEAVCLNKTDAEALARHFNLIPEPKTPEEVADIERLVASSSRLGNGG